MGLDDRMDDWERRVANSAAFDRLDRLDQRLGLNRPPKKPQARWVRYGGIQWLAWVIVTTVVVLVSGDLGYFALLVIPAFAYAMVFGLRALPRRRS